MTLAYSSVHQSLDLEAPRCLHDVLALHAASHPEVAAVAEEAPHLTYRTFDAQANQLAHVLRQLGVGPNTVVALSIHQGRYRLETMVALFGILKAGGAYVILDDFYPPEHIPWIMEDAQVRLVLTLHQRLAKRTDGAPLAVPVVCLDDPAFKQRVSRQPSTPPQSGVQASDLAYLIYTSGSTGRPKGVQCIHAPLVQLAAAQGDLYQVKVGDRLSQLFPLRFDGSVSEIVTALGNGATLCLPPSAALRPGPKTIAWLEQEHIRLLHCTPSYLAALPDAHLPELAAVVLGGELCPTELAMQHHRAGRRVYPSYGLTETAVCVTSGLYPGDGSEPTLGYPYPHAALSIWDEDGKALPRGEVGELVVFAPLARGYTDPALSASRFLPYGEGYAFRTGDLVCEREDGVFLFVGRNDEQHKLHGGVLVNLQGIEQTLNRYPGVRASKAVLRENKTLVAYVVLNRRGQVPMRELRQFLQKWLPAPSVPACCIELESLPLTPNGKASAEPAAYPLPTAADEARYEEEFRPPVTATELALAELVVKLTSHPLLPPEEARTVNVLLTLEELGVDSLALGVFELEVAGRFHSQLPEEQLALPLFALSSALDGGRRPLPELKESDA